MRYFVGVDYLPQILELIILKFSVLSTAYSSIVSIWYPLIEKTFVYSRSQNYKYE